MSCSIRTSTSQSSCTMPSKSIGTPRQGGVGARPPPRACSVYGGAFGGSTRTSSSSVRMGGCYPDMQNRTGGAGGYGGFAGLNSGGCGAGNKAGGSFGGDVDYLQQNEKITMQNLNTRLATYLEKVQSLEAANANLERLIREFYEKKGPVGQKDYSAHWATIKELKDKIKTGTSSNATILLQIDNSRLAADDFRMKYENELVMRQTVEADTANLRCLKDQTTRTKADLEMEIKGLEEELAFMKKNHQEELAAQKPQLNGSVNVELEAAPQQDLNKILEEIRADYEAIIQKQRKDQEDWFNEKTAQLTKEVATKTEDIETSKTQIKDLRRTLQTLEIELQTQLSMKASLESTLAETEAKYSSMLAEFQNKINVLEAELCQVRASIEQQGRDYAMLLDIKSRLEQEIATYRSLLENQDNKTQGQGGSQSGSSAGSSSLPTAGSQSGSSAGSHSFPSGGSQSIPSGGPQTGSSGGSRSIPSGGSQSTPSGGSRSFPSGVSQSGTSGGPQSFPSSVPKQQGTKTPRNYY